MTGVELKQVSCIILCFVVFITVAFQVNNNDYGLDRSFILNEKLLNPNNNLDKYLSRSVMVAGLVDHIGKNDYYELLEIINRLKPAYLSRVAGSWGLAESEQLPPNGSIYLKSIRLIEDLNDIYLNKMIDLPLLEAGIYEAITADVNKIEIPDFVLRSFKEDIDFIKYGYRDNPPMYFSVDSMINNSFDPWGTKTWTPDINKIQTRMWFYYLATVYIDMGCYSIHMGWFDRTFKNDQNYVKSFELFNLIRQYGNKKNKQVFINADVDRPIFYDSTDQLLLDFISSPLRPEPVKDLFQNTPCEDQPMTILNFDKYFPEIINFEKGFDPAGNLIYSVPTLFNLDWYGIDYLGLSPPHTGFKGNGWAPWGVNESIWFYILSPECQSYWFMNASNSIKNKFLSRGYFKVPVVQPLTWWGYTESEYLLSDYPEVFEMFYKQFMEVNNNPKIIISKRVQNYISQSRQYSLQMKIANPSMTDIYEWKVINKKTKKGLGPKMGSEIIFNNVNSGEYLVEITVFNWFAGSSKISKIIKLN